MPRIVSCAKPVFCEKATDGARPARSSTVLTRSRSSSVPGSTLTAIGSACASSSPDFPAVTTTFSKARTCRVSTTLLVSPAVRPDLLRRRCETRERSLEPVLAFREGVEGERTVGAGLRLSLARARERDRHDRERRVRRIHDRARDPALRWRRRAQPCKRRPRDSIGASPDRTAAWSGVYLPQVRKRSGTDRRGLNQSQGIAVQVLDARLLLPLATPSSPSAAICLLQNNLAGRCRPLGAAATRSAAQRNG